MKTISKTQQKLEIKEKMTKLKMAKSTNKKSVEKNKKIKLIEGKYSHKFLCRLVPQDGAKFDEISKNNGIKTFNQTVVFLINKNKKQSDYIDELLYKLDEQSNKIESYEEIIESLRTLKKSLNILK